MVGLEGRKLGSCWKMRSVGFVYWDIVIICHPRERIIRLGTPTGHIHSKLPRAQHWVSGLTSSSSSCISMATLLKWLKWLPKCCQQQLTFKAFKVSAEAEMSPNSEFVNAQTSWNPRVSEITCGHRAAIERYIDIVTCQDRSAEHGFSNKHDVQNRAKRNDAPQQLWMPLFDHVYPKLALYFLLTRYTLGKKAFETGCKTCKVPFILGRTVNWWLPCGDHFSHQGGSCHQCPWGPRLQLPKPGNFHTVQTCCRCRLSAPESAGGPFEATQAPKNLSSSPWASAPFARRNTATAVFSQCQETRVFRDPVDAKMSLPSQTLCQPHAKGLSLGFCKQDQASNPTKQELLLIENVPQALSFKCLRQFSIKSNSRFVSIVLLKLEVGCSVSLEFCPFSTLYFF